MKIWELMACSPHSILLQVILQAWHRLDFILKNIFMDSITDDALDPPNQLLLTEKSSAIDQLDAPNEAWESQPDRAFHIGATLKGIPG